MKHVVFTYVAMAAFLAGCEKTIEKTDHDVFFKIGNDHAYRFSDIELYDSSTFILYFKEPHPEFKEFLQSEFAFFDKGDTIYSGPVLPAYSSYIPAGPFIQSPSLYGDYALWFCRWYDAVPDVRNNPRLIEILKNHNLLHSGLSGSVDSVEVGSTQLSFSFTVINKDLTDLLILDINKTGPNLFHYFTNGPCLRDRNNNQVWSPSISPQQPDPWESWKPEWLTLLKSGKSISFTIDYPVEDQIDPGEYELSFQFPGLAYQVSKDELYQGNERIWLGDITLNSRITIP